MKNDYRILLANLRSKFKDEVEQRMMLKLETGLEPVTTQIHVSNCKVRQLKCAH